MVCVLQCPKPVIAAVHNACVGGGVDLICSADIRYCTSDAWFQVKEVDIGGSWALGFFCIISNRRSVVRARWATSSCQSVITSHSQSMTKGTRWLACTRPWLMCSTRMVITRCMSRPVYPRSWGPTDSCRFWVSHFLSLEECRVSRLNTVLHMWRRVSESFGV